MRVLLVNAPVTRANIHSRLSPPLGLAYIAAALLEAGHEVSALDLNVSGMNESRVAGLLAHDLPDVVGVSAMTETYDNALAVARLVKAFDPRIAVVLGGAHPTILPEAVLAEDAVDYVVVGDGERTMVELVASLSGEGPALPDVLGLGFKDAGVHVNARRELGRPDDLPLPARDIFPLGFYEDRYNILTAIGSCPYRCPFCSASSIWEGRRIARSPRSVAEEIESLQERAEVDYVFFTDDLFTLDKRWARELLGELLALERPIQWGCATRADLVDPGLLQEMAAAGCIGVQFGVESGSQRILDEVKHIKKETVLGSVRAATEAGIDVASSFMLPFPEDTRETLLETKQFMREVHEAGSSIMLNFTCPFPGTTFRDRAEELGVRILPTSWSEYDAKHVVMETKHLSAAEILDAAESIAAELGLKRSV